MPTKAPFRLQSGWLRYFGYPGQRRYVGLFWEPCGDEACYHDGQTFVCGLCESHGFLALVHRADVQAWLDRNGFFLGSSDREARHWLIADVATNEVYAAAVGEAQLSVAFQDVVPDGGEGP